MKLDLILRVTTKLLIPFMLLFALYVQFHGDYGPGGGFQAGCIAAGAVILYALIFGLPAAQRAVPIKLLQFLIPFGVLIFTATGIASMLKGGQFLNYTPLAHEQTHAQEMGIIIVEFGVLVTVFSTMLAIFYAFADRSEDEQ